MFQLKSIGKRVVNVPGNIRFYTILMKTIVSVVVESQKSKESITNYDKKKKVRFTCPTCKRIFGSYGQKKKDITCPYCEKI